MQRNDDSYKTMDFQFAIIFFQNLRKAFQLLGNIFTFWCSQICTDKTSKILKLHVQYFRKLNSHGEVEKHVAEKRIK